MPQKDRHRNREIPIEFNFYDTLEKLPLKQRYSIVLLTSGSALLRINNHIIEAKSPSVLCITQYDQIILLKNNKVSAKSLHFDPWFIKACHTFENLMNKVPVEQAQVHNQEMLLMFLSRHGTFQGYFELAPNQHLHLNETLSFIGAEILAQSDKFWTCRIRRLLLQVLNTIFDLYIDQNKLNFYATKEFNVVTLCVDYIHEHFDQEITLPMLCNLANLNRTSLNEQFKQQLNMTCMEYLMNYRIEMAKEMLSNTKLKISEISTVCGFKYDTYFMKQFQKKCGITPSAFRKHILSLK